jgi:hypothetical protein
MDEISNQRAESDESAHDAIYCFLDFCSSQPMLTSIFRHELYTLTSQIVLHPLT